MKSTVFIIHLRHHPTFTKLSITRLLPAVLKLDIKLISLDIHNLAIAEFFVEDAHTHGEIIAAFLGEAGGAAGVFF